MTEQRNLEEMIKDTDALTYLNAIKAGMAELKEQLATVEEMAEYMNQAVERARKIIRRLDNQYRAVVKAALGTPTKIEAEVDQSFEELMEEI